ncbi:MAG: iron-sulfur cluster assembly accessory protein [Venatoribacter sp.]
MSIETWDPNAPLLTLTEAAATHLAKLLAKQPDKNAIHLGVKKSGCSGFKYDIELVSEAKTGDTAATLSGLTFYLSQEALEHVRGIEIDYVKEGLNSSLKYNNPNAENVCGCGESFS